MTRISPRHAHDMQIHFARMHRRRRNADLRLALRTGLTALAVVLLAATAGYLFVAGWATALALPDILARAAAEAAW